MIDFFPLVSIIIPVYNGSNYMRQAIDSALSQTYKNIEIIVVNDGSDDNGATREIALSYGKKIRYFEKENGGVSTALNLGIRKMRGDYFSWLSHDDMYEPEKLEIEIEALKLGGDIKCPVYSNFKLLFMPDERVEINGGMEKNILKKYVNSGFFAVTMGFINGCSLLIHKEYFEKYGLFDEKLRAVQDYVKWLEMFKDRDMLYIDEPLVTSRCHEKQVGQTYKNLEKEKNLLFNTIEAHFSDERINKFDMSMYEFLSMYTYSLDSRNYTKEANHIRKCIKEENDKIEDRRKRRIFVKEIEGISESVYLYCMGQQSKAFFKALYERGVSVAGFSDKNMELWGTDYYGVKCVPINQIPKDALIIVAKKNPKTVVSELITRGFNKVRSYEEFFNSIMMTSISKDRILI